mgnify:CR=1 FL=1|jgi:uncharacterized protein (DUF3084 family)
MDELSQLISSVGFPIAASIALFYLYDKTMREVVSTLQEVRDNLRNLNDQLEGKYGND